MERETVIPWERARSAPQTERLLGLSPRTILEGAACRPRPDFLIRLTLADGDLVYPIPYRLTVHVFGCHWSASPQVRHDLAECSQHSVDRPR